MQVLRNSLKTGRKCRRRDNVDGDDVFSIHDLAVYTAGGKITMAELIRVRDGKTAKQTIYYDPREFSKVFGMMEK